MTNRAVIQEPGKGEIVEIGGVHNLVKLTGGDTGGLLSFVEFTVTPDAVPVPPHVHREHDEYFYVVHGELTVHTGEGEAVVSDGGLVAAVRGTVHGFRNAGRNPVKVLSLFTPSGYENYFREVHQAITSGSELTDELLVQIRVKYATEPANFPPPGGRA
jgi:quercetin dioxygenase-like cupin family protein